MDLHKSIFCPISPPVDFRMLLHATATRWQHILTESLSAQTVDAYYRYLRNQNNMPPILLTPAVLVCVFINQYIYNFLFT